VGHDIETPVYLNFGIKNDCEIYKPQECIDYEYTDPADPFGDTSKGYPQLMYPAAEDDEVTPSMVGGAS
jgi:hypothetical protein